MPSKTSQRSITYRLEGCKTTIEVFRDKRGKLEKFWLQNLGFAPLKEWPQIRDFLEEVWREYQAEQAPCAGAEVKEVASE